MVAEASASDMLSAVDRSSDGTSGQASTLAMAGPSYPRTESLACPGTFRVPQVSDMIGFPRRQREVERRTLAHPPLRPHAPAVSADDPLDDRESGAGAGEIFR